MKADMWQGCRSIINLKNGNDKNLIWLKNPGYFELCPKQLKLGLFSRYYKNCNKKDGNKLLWLCNRQFELNLKTECQRNRTQFEIFVKLFVHFVSVCLKAQKWTQTDTIKMRKDFRVQLSECQCLSNISVY